MTLLGGRHCSFPSSIAVIQLLQMIEIVMCSLQVYRGYKGTRVRTVQRSLRITYCPMLTFGWRWGAKSV